MHVLLSGAVAGCSILTESNVRVSCGMKCVGVSRQVLLWFRRVACLRRLIAAPAAMAPATKVEPSALGRGWFGVSL